MMATCELYENLDQTRKRVHEHEPMCTNNGMLQSPVVTVHGPRNLSISSSCSSTSSGSAASSPESSPTSTSDLIRAMETNSDSRHGRRSPTSIIYKPGNDTNPVLRANFNKIRTKDDDLSNNNHCSPTMDILRYNRRSLSRSNSKCSSISEDGSETESEPSLTPRLRPPLQRNSAIHEDGQLSPRCASPIEELETLSGIKTVIRRPGKPQNGRSSPSWRWSVIGYAAGDYDAVSRATHKTSPSSVPVTTSSTSSTTLSSNAHPALSRRSSFGLSPAGVNRSPAPGTNVRRMSASFRRLSLQMDMPWRDPNERLVQFADWLIKRTEEIMERSARARQKTYELLRMARQRQKDRVEY